MCTILNLKPDFIITGGAFKCWNALLAVDELHNLIVTELFCSSLLISVTTRAAESVEIGKEVPRKSYMLAGN